MTNRMGVMANFLVTPGKPLPGQLKLRAIRTKARAVNANLANELILLQTLLNELLAARMNLKNAETSQAVKVVDTDSTVSPFSCDPVILEQMQIPQNLWPDCAQTQSSGSGLSETLTPLSGSAASVVEAIQNQAN